MIPVDCMVNHNPPDTWGDCVRACVASILDLGSPDVPHFYHDGCEGDIGVLRLTTWLNERGQAPVFMAYQDDGFTLDAFLTLISPHLGNAHYMLVGRQASGESHAVVCHGDKVVHNPSWSRNPIVAPGEDDQWAIMVIAVK